MTLWTGKEREEGGENKGENICLSLPLRAAPLCRFALAAVACWVQQFTCLFFHLLPPHYRAPRLPGSKAPVSRQARRASTIHHPGMRPTWRHRSARRMPPATCTVPLPFRCTPDARAIL